jgi:hypothetical protein
MILLVKIQGNCFNWLEAGKKSLSSVCETRREKAKAHPKIDTPLPLMLHVFTNP